LADKPSHVPAGYEPLKSLAEPRGLSTNAVRLMAHRRQIRALLIRNKIYGYEPDLDALYQPRPYPVPPIAA
jgi:hypothetical protein